MMAVDDSSPNVLRNVLRAGTASSHESLDGKFGALDLSERDGFARFLVAHHIGVTALYPIYHAFVADVLGLAPPDHPAMLRRDLAAMGYDPSHLPKIAADVELDPLAVTYVLAGSRLGLAMLGRSEYWGRRDDRAAAYMNDTQGLTVWRGLMARLGETADARDRDHIVASANAAFALFEQAFALSGNVVPARP